VIDYGSGLRGFGSGVDDFGVGGGADVAAGFGAASVFGFGGLGGGALSPGFITLVAAVVPSRAVKNVGGSSPSSRGRTLKLNPYSVLRLVATLAPMNFLLIPAWVPFQR